MGFNLSLVWVYSLVDFGLLVIVFSGMWFIDLFCLGLMFEIGLIGITLMGVWRLLCGLLLGFVACLWAVGFIVVLVMFSYLLF